MTPFGVRANRADQSRILQSALDSIRPERPAAAFDLDSTLLVNKTRQARIVRELGEAVGDRRLAACQAEAVGSWDLRDTARLCGLSEQEIKAIVPQLRDFWKARFFTSEYCRDDTPVPGASDFLRRVLGKGGEILYVTGRHQEMAEGTLESFRRAGFPAPDGERAE